MSWRLEGLILRAERRVRSASQSDRVASRPHVAEWFGHRVFPTVSSGDTPIGDQESKRCPFLTQTLKHSTPCVKAANSRGVCTISASSNGPRQDWLVCPYRALDDGLLGDMVCRLYGIPPLDRVLIRPVVALGDEAGKSEILTAVRGSGRVFVYFQDKLGGEISLAKTAASPELSFDITVVELLPAPPSSEGSAPGSGEPTVTVGRYGVIELQTTDTHGSYAQAVSALNSALDLHKDRFSEQLAENPEWAGRKVEGPNISNVFKRTFYQIAFKFQVTKRNTSAGCALALPQPVWDSWQPFLGAPELHEQADGTWRLMDDHTLEPSDWIYVFDIDTQPGAGGHPAPIRVSLVIGTDAATLSRAAFEVAPAKAVTHSGERDAVAETITRRLGRYLSEIS
jgi:hypothetical protein